MDTLSHGLWGGVAFGRKNKWQFIAGLGFGTWALLAGAYLAWRLWKRAPRRS